MRIAGILLGAGAGTRFRAAGGRRKLLAPIGGRPLIERPLRALLAAGLDEVVVVLGSGADEILAQADLSARRVLVHPGWADGMASSLAAGLAALPAACEAAIVVLGDGPWLSTEAVRRVAGRVAEGDAPLVGRALRERSRGTRPRCSARSGRACRRRARTARVPWASRASTSTAPTSAPPGDADTPAELEGAS